MTAPKATAPPNRPASRRCPPNRFRVAPFNYDYDTMPPRPPAAKKPRRRHQNYGYDSLPPVRQPHYSLSPKNRRHPVAVWPNRDPYGEAGSFNVMGFVNNDGINNFDAFGLYNSAGHFSTTYLIAIAAGMSPDQAFQYAYWSQYPDQNSDFSAVHTSLTLEWEVGQYLHSLTGGDPFKLRQYLECLLKSGKFSVAEQGMLIHALGDAYAHTYVDTAKFTGSGHGRVPNPNYGQLRSYGPGIGHLFDGHAPDYIGNNPTKYGEYVDQLYEVMQSLNPGGSYDPSMVNNLKLQAYLMPPSNVASDLGSTEAQNGTEAFLIGILPGGFDGSSNPFNPDNPNAALRTLPDMQMPVESYTGDSRDSLIYKIKNGVDGCCPDKK